MGCYDPPHSFCHHGIEDVENLLCSITKSIKKFDETRKREEGEFQELKKHSDKLTDMLCRLCFALETVNAIFPSDIKIWWEQHKAWDEERNNKK